MSISSEITRLNGLKTKIKTALIAWGLVNSTAKLDDCATAIDAVTVYKNVSAQVQEGTSYTIPKGYHDGSGTVAGVAGGGNYSLQSKSVTPTKSEQTITSDVGYYGLDSVTVSAIPAAYQDISVVTATANDVLAPKVVILSDGTQAVGKITNQGSLSGTIDGLNKMSYTLAAGYYTGGSVTLTDDIENALAEI